MFSRIRRQRAAKVSSSGPRLRHVVVAGGELDDWEAMTATQWTARVGLLAAVAATHGARWVTVFPFGSRPVLGCQMTSTSYEVDGVHVLVSPHADGRRRIAETLRGATDVEFDEDSVEQLLHGDAGEPDLVVVLGSDDRLPPSLVWELAYSELVFLPVDWSVLDGERLDDALGVYFGRERRFGGVDE
ncbi:MAG: undecaprenyl diphosphate synthase family protein [Actinomycetes bacterium]